MLPNPRTITVTGRKPFNNVLIQHIHENTPTMPVSVQSYCLVARNRDFRVQNVKTELRLCNANYIWAMGISQD